MSTLDIRTVSKSYGAVVAVAAVDLNVQAGSRTAIVGPSGCGKTTLLRLIAGFEVPDQGSITFNGRVLVDGTTLVPAHQRVIGFLPQNGALFPHLSVAGNIGYGLAKSLPDRAQRIAALVDLVALDQAMLKRWPHELSGGQQQRVALARALAQQPKLMLLDEPFSALDTGLRAATRKAVAQVLMKAGVTTILVTHDQEEALSFADQVAVMRDGRLIQVGRPTELYLRPRDEATATFLGEAIILPAIVGQGWADCVLGRISVDDAQASGQRQIVLRPEQLHVTEMPATEVDGQIGCGHVVDVDFVGYACLLGIKVAGAAAGQSNGTAPILQVRCPNDHVPLVGAGVRITVTKPAHVLDGRA
jgi:iron(III) transport system ATP-binding protein